MNSSNSSLKIFSLIIFILSLAGCQTQPDYTIVKGKLLGSDNTSLVKANVSLNYTTSGKAIQVVEISKDGSYEIELKHDGIFNLTFSGVNHEAITVPILNDRRESIQLNVKLQRYNYVDNFEDVNIIGDFNHFNFRSSQRMTKQNDGTFTAEFKTDKDSLAYQLLGIEKTGRSINGTMSDKYVYDGGGDYRSVVAVKDGKVKIVFDPSKIKRDEIKPVVTFRNDDRQSKLYSLRERLDAREKNYRIEAAKTPGQKPQIDYSKDFADIKQKIESATSDFDRNIQYINYLHLADLSGENQNNEIVKKAFKTIEPSSYLWSIDPTVLDLSIQQDNNKNKYEYVDKVINRNKDMGVVAYLFYVKMDEAQSAGNLEEAKKYQSNLKNNFSETPFGKYASLIVIDTKITAGKPVPSFSVKSLIDSRKIFSNKSLKGKVYLIDFWASWCQPCIGEMPYLHEAYKKYHDKGFEILSLSFDQKAGDIEKFRKAKWPMPWDHSFVDNGFKSDLAKEFQVEGIPKPILVNKDGKIIATESQVRGQNLLEVLNKVYSN